MTEAEWLTCDDPSVALEHMARPVGARKVRLALCGCLRTPQIWSLLSASSSRRAVETCEAFADGGVSRKELGEARGRANGVAGRAWRERHTNQSAAYLANFVCLQDHNLLAFLHLPRGYLRELRSPTGPLRDVFGNPFRPVTFDPRWRTADVLGLARGIYEDRAFDRLPLLADALMDAGCADEQVIGHCRSGGPHVRGCWVVDLVLGKE
jgi:hypothetical protein